MSSCCGLQVLPGGGFVVEVALLQADVEDANPAVSELSQRLAVGLAAGAELVVIGASAGRWDEGAERPLLQGAGQAPVAGVAGQDDMAAPGGFADGDVPA